MFTLIRIMGTLHKWTGKKPIKNPGRQKLQKKFPFLLTIAITGYTKATGSKTVGKLAASMCIQCLNDLVFHAPDA